MAIIINKSMATAISEMSMLGVAAGKSQKVTGGKKSHSNPWHLLFQKGEVAAGKFEK